jgi:thiol-disulfide isomerase/thioredoxin
LNIRKLIKTLLFVFVLASFAVLIYKEFSPRSESNAPDAAVTKGAIASVSDKAIAVAETQTAEEPSTKQKQETPSPQIPVTAQGGKVIVYYFHGTARCPTCKTIEKYSREAVEHYFPNELKNGKLVFMTMNVEDAANRHYIQDYKLFSKSLVVSLVKQDKEVTWKNLTDVWKLVGDKDKFFQYVKDEVENLLKQAS